MKNNEPAQLFIALPSEEKLKTKSSPLLSIYRVTLTPIPSLIDRFVNELKGIETPDTKKHVFGTYMSNEEFLRRRECCTAFADIFYTQQRIIPRKTSKQKTLQRESFKHTLAEIVSENSDIFYDVAEEPTFTYQGSISQFAFQYSPRFQSKLINNQLSQKTEMCPTRRRKIQESAILLDREEKPPIGSTAHIYFTPTTPWQYVIECLHHAHKRSVELLTIRAENCVVVYPFLIEIDSIHCNWTDIPDELRKEGACIVRKRPININANERGLDIQHVMLHVNAYSLEEKPYCS